MLPFWNSKALIPGADIQVFNYAGPSNWQTWRKPLNKTWAHITCLGGGGGGASGGSDATVGGAGGGGGMGGVSFYCLVPLLALPESIFALVGAGGIAGASIASPGTGNHGSRGGSSVLALSGDIHGTLSSASHSGNVWTCNCTSDSRINTAGQGILLSGQTTVGVAESLNDAIPTTASSLTSFTLTNPSSVNGTYSATGTVNYKLLFDCVAFASGGFGGSGGLTMNGSSTQSLWTHQVPVGALYPLTAPFLPANKISSGNTSTNAGQDGNATITRIGLGSSQGAVGGGFLGPSAGGSFSAAGGVGTQQQYPAVAPSTSADASNGWLYHFSHLGFPQGIGGLGGPSSGGLGYKGGRGFYGCGGGGGGGSNGVLASGDGGSGGDGLIIITCW